MGIVNGSDGIEEHFCHVDRLHFISDPAQVIQTLLQAFFCIFFRFFRQILFFRFFFLFDLLFNGAIGKSQHDQFILQPFFPKRQQIRGLALPGCRFAVDPIGVIAGKKICGEILQEFFSIVAIFFLTLPDQLIHLHCELKVAGSKAVDKCFRIF